jgi:predicted NBD/HSP70 family sugar kinase
MGRPFSPPAMPSWEGYPIADRLSARFVVDTWVDNEANLVALGEFRSGAAQQVDDFILVKVGSGIGAGLIAGGRLYRGALGSAGGIAHLPVPADHPVTCYCGKQGCLVTLASGLALGRRATEMAADGSSLALSRLAATLDRPLTAADLALRRWQMWQITSSRRRSP